MPRFAANLGILFTERPLIERFARGRRRGLRRGRTAFPYDHAPFRGEGGDRPARPHDLGRQHRAVGRAGEFGLGAVPGREQEFAALFRQALDYVVAIGGCQIHCLAGKVPPEQRPAAETTFIAQSRARRRSRGGKEASRC